MAGILTAAMVVALTIYAIYTKSDFTTKGGIFFIGIIVLIVGSILGAIIQNKWLNLVLSVFGVFLFGCYLIYDT